jgi:GNAT superfamily N-acetyltransferase
LRERERETEEVGTSKEDRGSKSRSLGSQPAYRGKGISRRLLRQTAKNCSDGVKVKVQVKDWVWQQGLHRKHKKRMQKITRLLA